LTVIYGKFDKGFRYSGRYKETFNDSRFIYTLISDEYFMTVLISDNLVEFHKIIDPLLVLGSKYKFYEEAPTVVHFPFELSEFVKLIDFADVVNDVLDQDFRKDPAGLPDIDDMRLTKNVNEVLKGMIRHPEITTVELARRLGLTRATVTNKQKALLDRHMLRRVMIPDLIKLNCEMIASFM